MTPPAPATLSAGPSEAEVLHAAAGWAEARPFQGIHLGISPALNAVVELNPAAAVVWEALRLSPSLAAAEALYAELCPQRAAQAPADVAACLDGWRAAGLFRPAPPAPAPQPADPPAGDWLFDRTIAVAGQPVAVRAADPELAAALEDMLAGFADAPAPAPEAVAALADGAGGWLVIDGTRAVRREPDRAMARAAVFVALLHRAAGETPWLGLLHGACLDGPQGGVLLAAASGAGKSTLAASLLAEGWRLVAEDAVALTPALEAVPLPFALSIKRGAWALLAGRYPDLATARTHVSGTRHIRHPRLPAACWAAAPVRPRAILFVRYDPVCAPACRPVAPLAALRALLTDQTWINFGPAHTDRFLDWIETTPAFDLAYPSTDDALRLIGQCLGAGTSAAGS